MTITKINEYQSRHEETGFILQHVRGLLDIRACCGAYAEAADGTWTIVLGNDLRSFMTGLDLHGPMTPLGQRMLQDSVYCTYGYTESPRKATAWRHVGGFMRLNSPRNFNPVKMYGIATRALRGMIRKNGTAQPGASSAAYSMQHINAFATSGKYIGAYTNGGPYFRLDTTPVGAATIALPLGKTWSAFLADVATKMLAEDDNGSQSSVISTIKAACADVQRVAEAYAPWPAVLLPLQFDGVGKNWFVPKVGTARRSAPSYYTLAEVASVVTPGSPLLLDNGALVTAPGELLNGTANVIPFDAASTTVPCDSGTVVNGGISTSGTSVAKLDGCALGDLLGGVMAGSVSRPGVDLKSSDFFATVNAGVYTYSKAMPSIPLDPTTGQPKYASGADWVGYWAQGAGQANQFVRGDAQGADALMLPSSQLGAFTAFHAAALLGDVIAMRQQSDKKLMVDAHWLDPYLWPSYRQNGWSDYTNDNTSRSNNYHGAPAATAFMAADLSIDRLIAWKDKDSILAA